LVPREVSRLGPASEDQGFSSPAFGYTLINYELGQRLVALRRPAEGIPIVQAALRGGIEGPGLYVTGTELHELLAQLFDASHARDSAAAHYAVIARAWASADPMLRPRFDAARGWLAADEQTGFSSVQVVKTDLLHGTTVSP
jgi:hypothetical protein